MSKCDQVQSTKEGLKGPILWSRWGYREGAYVYLQVYVGRYQERESLLGTRLQRQGTTLLRGDGLMCPSARSGLHYGIQPIWL